MTSAGWHRRGRGTAVAVLSTVVLLVGRDVHAQSLRGSSQSLDRQNRIARQHDFTYLKTASNVQSFAAGGYLVRVRGTAAFQLDDEVSFPYARPEVVTFVERLGQQYQSACGEQLVVTSLTRPSTRQPSNASSRSVHPTGMAVDLRRSNHRACRSWLENTLLYLEGQGVVEATRERRPPHYHVAVFPEPYADYVQAIAQGHVDEVARITDAGQVEYRVRQGDSLWAIAKQHGTTVASIQDANEIRGSRIYAGQLLQVPLTR
jgi:nucleoid-associated protein YgaU